MTTRLLFSAACLALLWADTARADYARPPDDPYGPPRDAENSERWETERAPRSTVRLFTGPVVRFTDEAVRGGLGLALDAGSRAAGVRFGGAWVRAGQDGGLSQYSAELWIDFAETEWLHPVLAAGAGAVRLDREDPDTGGVGAETVGVGLLRATLQYRLPVRGVDARAAVDVTGAVPALGSEQEAPWATAGVSVGVGF